MTHPNDGLLRRMTDEPMMVRETDRRHVAGCARCRNKLATIGEDARSVAGVLALSPYRPETSRALAAVRQRTAGTAQGGFRPARRVRSRWFASLAGGVGAATALAGAMALTPAGSWAQSFITIFQPKQIQAVPIQSGDLSALPDLRKYGTVHLDARPQRQTFSTPGAAAQAAGMRLLAPASLPPGTPSAVRYDVLPSTSGSFQFNAARAGRAARESGKALPAMPAHVNGSTLRVTIGNAVLAEYGRGGDIPALVVGQMRAPRVTSTGASVREIEDYVLSLPGVPPRLAQQLRSINDPATTLPLLVPVDKAHAHPVQVQGVQGLAIGDNTGLGTAVVWEKGDVMYGVGGTIPESEAIAVANSLR